MRKLVFIIIFSVLFISGKGLDVSAFLIGSEAYLHAKAPYPHIAINEAALDAYMKAVASGDIPHGVTELYTKKQLFQVNNDVRVKIIDSKFSKVQVRFLEGDAQGRSGWVVTEWITTDIPESRKPKTAEPRSAENPSYLSQFSKKYPAKIPSGYTKTIKGKYRVVLNIENNDYYLYDTNKIEFKGDKMVLAPPVFWQQWHGKDCFMEELCLKWTRETLKHSPDIMEWPKSYFSIIEQK
jgi:hypothetical protein